MTKILTPNEYPGLPKWPAAFITGKSVTPEQAKEIIFRTDTSIQLPTQYGFGNDRRFAAKCRETFGWKPLNDAEDAWLEIHKMPDSEKDAAIEKLLPAGSSYQSLWDVRSAWAQELGIIETAYVTNDWLSSAYIGGPSGWCSPKGVIHYEGHNYGKWPSVNEIVEDWTMLAEAFPYLDIVCTLYSGEYCEDHIVPECTIRVVNGTVTVYAPDESMHEQTRTVTDTSSAADLRHLMAVVSGNYAGERGWPPEWIAEFGERSTAAMKKVAPWLW